MNHLRALVRADEEQGDEKASSSRKSRLARLSRRKKAPVVNLDEGLGKEVGERLDDLVNFLGDRPFFYADQPSRADLAVYSFLHNMPTAAGPEVAAAVEAREPLVELMARVAAAVR
jgi:glutathione S-transferase